MNEEAAVEFAIRTEPVSRLNDLSRGISERLMTLRFQLAANQYAMAISAYAAALARDKAKWFLFFEAYRGHLQSVHWNEKNLLEDFDIRVGSDLKIS